MTGPQHDPARSPAAPDLVLRGATVVTMNPERSVYAPGYVAVAGGRISAAAPGEPEQHQAAEIRNLEGRVILPGFVNTHDHLVSALTRGLGGDRFLSGGDPQGRAVATAVRESLDGPTCYAGARLALSELLLSGVTTTTDSQAARRGLEEGCDGTLQAITESGMRAVFFRASVDRTEIVPLHQHDDSELARSELDRLHGTWVSERVLVGAEAMAMHRVGPDMVRDLHEWTASHGAPFAMHISYSEAAARYAIDEHGDRLLKVLEDWGVLDDRFLGYHPVWLDEAEIEAAVRHDAGLALCAPANMLIGAAAAPLPELEASGVRLGLGTDQPNDGHNFFEVMKATILQQRASRAATDVGSPEQALELATIGGARALHMEDEIGSIEVGKRADLVVIDSSRPALHPLPARISNLVYAASPADVASVLIDGRDVIRDGEPTAWDLTEVGETADRAVGTALARAGLETNVITAWPVIRS